MILIHLSMSERLQVILERQEYSIVRKAASHEGKSISDWVRGLIRERLARRSALSNTNIVETFRRLSLPSPPIDQMIKEIEEGRS